PGLGALDQRPELVLARRVDEGLDRDVVVRLRLPEELVERAARLHVRIATRREHLVRLVLRRLHVRLVERVDAENRARNGGRELPAVELVAELVRAGQPYLRRLAVRRVGRLVRRGNQALAVLARRLREQLLGPRAEAARC